MSASRHLSGAEVEAVTSIVVAADKTARLQVDLVEGYEGCKEGENYMSVVTRVEVIGHSLKTKEPFRLTLMMKRVPESEIRRLLFHCDPAFRNEVVFYRDVLPLMDRFSGGCSTLFPGCLHASEDLLLLRHLQQDDFVMADRKSGLDLEHSALVMKTLGRFHGISLAMKYAHPLEFDRTKHIVQEVPVVSGNTIFETSVEHAVRRALICLRGEGCPEYIVSKLSAVEGNVYSILKPLVTAKEPLAVINHGDLWNNNMLFRYSQEDHCKIVKDVCFLDLQGTRYASPALDILYFLYTSTKSGVTEHHFYKLVGIYYATLKKTMLQLAPTAPSVTFKDILKEIKEHSLFGLLMAFVLLPAITAEDVIVSLDDLTEEKFLSQEYVNSLEECVLTPRLVSRVRDMVKEFRKRGFL